MTTEHRATLYDNWGNPVSSRSITSTVKRSTGRGEGGGIANFLTGQGGLSDKTESLFFYPTTWLTRNVLETIYNESWAAKKLINIPIDDMFVNGREWLDADETVMQAFDEAYDDLDIYDHLQDAMKAGRLFGTSLVFPVLANQDPVEPLDFTMIHEGDLRNFIIFDRYDCSVHEYGTDIEDRSYGKPVIYNVVSRVDGRSILVHESRLLRFDGGRSVTTGGWSGSYEQHWGISELIPALVELRNDSALAGAIVHLAQEASIPVVKIQGFKDAISARPSRDEPSIEELGTRFNLYKSMYRTLFMDANDDFTRTNAQMGGLPPLMDAFAQRISAMAGIPITRFMSRSPAGLNATGAADMQNYAIMVSAMQNRDLEPRLRYLDRIVAQHLGIREDLAPDYRWLPMTELSEAEKIAVSKAKADALAVVYDRQSLTEEEFRERLSGDSLFDVLEELDMIPVRSDVDVEF